jgi:hypothetical protein
VLHGERLKPAGEIQRSAITASVTSSSTAIGGSSPDRMLNSISLFNVALCA